MTQQCVFCPVCAAPIPVVESRLYFLDGEPVRYRRRLCKTCRHQIRTIETVLSERQFARMDK